ncbi:MAG: tocopherol cyclase family protein [Bacillota bacterium]|nr:tocopherol cyclase family protein [Bacillota bacterium]
MNLKSLRNPDLYHDRTEKTFFEGWYFKLVDAGMENAFAFIPGIYYSPNRDYSHSFIQIVDGMKKTYDYLRFPVESFGTDKRIFSLNIDKNKFGIEGLNFKLDRPEVSLIGKIKFSNHNKWPDNFLNPGSMGFYNYIPKMQCYSQVCSMDFDLSGSLDFKGQNIDFGGGKGYIEKNWGSAFPYSWIWIQCNHFQTARASFSCSIGHIPFLFSNFRGFLAGLYVNNDFYEFTSINHSKIEVVSKGSDVIMNFNNSRHRLHVKCKTEYDNFILLNGPRGDKMIPLVQENLQGNLHLELIDLQTGQTIINDSGRCAGVEYGGKQMMVLD